ncbi:MAG: nucleotide sugar dehydrogenase, partial [Actinomycetota bacterium]
VPDARLGAARARGFRATGDPASIGHFDVAIITVPTPLRDGIPDLSYIESAVAVVADHLGAGALVVLESTTYPGTTEELVRPALEQRGLTVGVDVFCGYSPERIDPGNPVWHLQNTPKIVAGCDAASRRAVEAFYATIVDEIVPVATTAEAELVKLLENTFRHVNVALVNELAMFARDLGVDIWNAIDAAATKPFGFMRFVPGPGVGGHCLPVDPSFLAWRVERQLGHRFRFVELANDVNRGMPEYVVRRAVALLDGAGIPVAEARVLLLGLAYKPGTSDWRESPAVAVARGLADLGAEVRAHDPYVPEDAGLGPSISRVDCDEAEIVGADLGVICTDHAERPSAAVAARARLVLPTRARLRDRDFRGEIL